MAEQDAPADGREPLGEAAPSRWSVVQPWLSMLVRLAMAIILIAAAIPKLQDIDQSVRAVRAYRLLPEAVVPLVGTGLPYLELALALVLLLGLFTRAGALVWNLMMLAFMTGVVWVWIKGYSIDCGCFGGGGDVDADATNYPLHMLERVGFLALGVYLWIFPRSHLSVDSWTRGESLIGRPAGK